MIVLLCTKTDIHTQKHTQTQTQTQTHARAHAHTHSLSKHIHMHAHTYEHKMTKRFSVFLDQAICLPRSASDVFFKGVGRPPLGVGESSNQGKQRSCHPGTKVV